MHIKTDEDCCKIKNGKVRKCSGTKQILLYVIKDVESFKDEIFRDSFIPY